MGKRYFGENGGKTAEEENGSPSETRLRTGKYPWWLNHCLSYKGLKF
jgi:hypothetical protein